MNTNRSYCQYVKAPTDDCGVEALRLFLPTLGGYINYNIVHSVMQKSNCNTWRLSVVYFCDGEFNRIRPLTRSGAEWEMALKIKERPDFIGGYAHGDEVFEKIAVKIDGREIALSDLADLAAFGQLTFEVRSRGYDPNDSETEAIWHYKQIIVDENGVRVKQRVEWLNDYELDNSYMAMFPPFKCETDFYFTDKETEKIPIPEKLNIKGQGDINTLYMCGNSGFVFSMMVEKYLTDDNGHNSYFLSDNGGVPYNKMYFYLQHGGKAVKGDVWETCTVYTVSNVPV